MRVMARLFEIEEDITRQTTQKQVRKLVEELLPEHESWVLSEALIELGATVCRPKAPLCERCPLVSQCQSALNGRETEIPVKAKKVQYEVLFRDVAVILFQDELLLKCGDQGKVMAGLYEFPYFPSEKGGLSQEEILNKIRVELAIDATFEKLLPEVKHSFTRYRVTLYPKLFIAHSPKKISGHSWHSLASRETLAFSSGHKRIIHSL
ncbi:MAG: putative A/G-specific adenine glycosylase, mutY [Chlamydiia bacterium]|nr:putative A/G-specific adenine glycosylase, mutY [Chlamydiia bacterium]